MNITEDIREHLAKGYRLTNEKLTLLHSVPCFQAIEAGSYAVAEELLVEFARALANDPRHIPADLKDRMQARYNDREFVVITSMGIMMLANNYFNDIMEVEPERL